MTVSFIPARQRRIVARLTFTLLPAALRLLPPKMTREGTVARVVDSATREKPGEGRLGRSPPRHGTLPHFPPSTEPSTSTKGCDIARSSETRGPPSLPLVLESPARPLFICNTRFFRPPVFSLLSAADTRPSGRSLSLTPSLARSNPRIT